MWRIIIGVCFFTMAMAADGMPYLTFFATFAGIGMIAWRMFDND